MKPLADVTLIYAAFMGAIVIVADLADRLGGKAAGAHRASLRFGRPVPAGRMPGGHRCP